MKKIVFLGFIIMLQFSMPLLAQATQSASTVILTRDGRVVDSSQTTTTASEGPKTTDQDASTAPGQGNSDSSGVTDTTDSSTYNNIKATYPLTVIVKDSSGAPIDSVNLSIGSLTGTTDGSGTFRINHMSTGAVTVSAAKPPYDTESRSVTVVGPTKVLFTLTRSYPVTVMVVDPWGAPMGSATLSIHGSISYTKPNGSYDFISKEGPLTLYAYYPGYNWGSKSTTVNGPITVYVSPEPIEVVWVHVWTYVGSFGNIMMEELGNYMAGSTQVALNNFSNFFGGNLWNVLWNDYGIGANQFYMIDRAGNLRGVDSYIVGNGGIYKAPDGNVYSVNSGYWSPVKVSLDGQDARLNSDDRFLFDLDGFNESKMPWIRTSGGLNTDEAWLVADRDHNGFFYNKTVMDGNDIFGDHLGKFKSGYEDLANLFKSELSTDASGKRYIPLHEMPWWEKLWVFVTRVFGFNTNWNASYDLKLLTRNHRVIQASEVLTKAYVDYQDVSEFDKDHKNWIRQRAMVEYVNGQHAQSADQWFQAILILDPLGKPASKPH